MTWNKHGSRRPGRKSFLPACEPLEDRNLLSGFNFSTLIGRLPFISGGELPPIGTMPPIEVSPGTPTLPPIVWPGDPAQSPVTVSKDMLRVTPGGDADSYTLVLNSKPTADVTITVIQGDPAVCALANLVGRAAFVPSGASSPLVISPTSLTFTPDNWDQPQMVKVSAPATADSSTPFVLLSHSVSSTDPNFSNVFVPDVFIQVGNLKPPIPPPIQTGGVEVSTQKLDLTPGGPAQTYTVVLTSQPTSNVTIQVSQQDPEVYVMIYRPIRDSFQLKIDPTTLTFTPDNWNTPQTITVSAPATPTAGDIPQITLLVHHARSDDPNYNDLFVPDVFVRVGDNLPPLPPPIQTGGVEVSTQKLALTPGGPAQTYTLVLTSQPTADVTIRVSQDDPRMNATPTPLFRPGIGDSVQLTIDPTTLTFTPDNWNIPQTITVSAPANPTAADLTQVTFLSHHVRSDDPNYNDLFVPNVFVRVGDDLPPLPPPIQTGGVEVSTHRLEVTPGGPAQTYTVVLTSQPTADVTISIGQSGIGIDPPMMTNAIGINTGGPLVVTPTTLTFTHDNWNQPQTVSVSLPGDLTAFEPRAVLTQTVTSDDPNFNGIPAPSVFVHLVPNTTTDRPGLVVSTHHLAVTAGDAAGATYTLALATRPTADVTVTVEDSFTLLRESLSGRLPPGANFGSITVTPQTLTFTPDNWNVAQTVTVTAPAPGTAFSIPFALLFNTLKSDDPNYNNTFTPPVFVAIHGLTPPIRVWPTEPPGFELPIIGHPVILPPIAIQPPPAQFLSLPPVPPKAHVLPAKNGSGQAQHTTAVSHNKKNPKANQALIRRRRRGRRPNKGLST